MGCYPLTQFRNSSKRFKRGRMAIGGITGRPRASGVEFAEVFKKTRIGLGPADGVAGLTQRATWPGKRCRLAADGAS